MALLPSIVSLIRDEVGDDDDFCDNVVDFDASLHIDSLEAIYIDSDRGNFSPLSTALVVWRRRLANMNARAFDITKEGSYMLRSQRARFLKDRVDHYERLTRQKPRHAQFAIASEAELAGTYTPTP